MSVLVEGDVLEDERADERSPVWQEIIRRKDGQSWMALLSVVNIVHHYLFFNRKLV
jgi:hypothetical protein